MTFQRLDPFLMAADLIGEAELTDEALAALDAVALRFLQGGGSVSLSEYERLSAASRERLSAVGERVAAAQAERIADAIMARLEDAAAGVEHDAAQHAIEGLVSKVVSP